MNESRVPPEIFCSRLREARELRDLSQSELAERAKLQPSAISHFESGTRKPSFDNLKRLANALEVTTDFLLGRSKSPGTHGNTADPLYRDIANLTADDRDILRCFIQALVNRNKRRYDRIMAMGREG